MGDPDGMDKSVPPMYRSHLDKIDTAYAREGTLEVCLPPAPPRPALHTCCTASWGKALHASPPSTPAHISDALSPAQSAKAAFDLTGLWIAAGRGGETAFQHLGLLNWDEHFKCHVADVAQTKTAKVKKIAIVAGKDRRCDFYLKFGDALALNTNRPIYNAGEPYYLYPELHAVAQPSRKIGSYIKSVYPVSDGGALKYKHVAVELPAGLCAGSIRPGVINTLIECMPPEFVVHTTGHELKSKEGSLYEYVDASTPLCIPGAIVLAGWPSLPWGTLGMGPHPPALEYLFMVKSETCKADQIDTVIDKLFHLDSSSPPECGEPKVVCAEWSPSPSRPW